MQVILHTGVHCTDEDKLLKCLLRNADAVRNDGVVIPGPGRYRSVLTEMLNSLGDGVLAPDAREVLVEDILDKDADQVSRLILSHENLFCVPKLALYAGMPYRWAEQRLRNMTRLFAGDDVHLFMGLRDPASYLPAVYKATPHEDFDSFLDGSDPMQFRWSDLVRRIRHDVPDLKITLWCNEDTPLIWGELLRDMLGLAPSRKIAGAFDILTAIMSPEGMRRFRVFLRDHPTINEEQKRRVMLAFLDKYALDEEIEEELDLPGWDDAYVTALTETYEADMQVLMQMPDVRFITP